MIIQTGMRTDIPAFYSDWFSNRLKEGFVLVRNPYNPSSVSRYELNPSVVDMIGFCSKNPAPMLKHMDLLKPYGQYWFVTVTPYGKDIEPHYLDIEEGAWRDESPYGVVHRIAADGSEKGVGTFCIQWAYEQCGHLRIDTHGDNTVMQNLLKKLGFVHCGTIYVEEDNDPRLAFEKSSTVHGENA